MAWLGLPEPGSTPDEPVPVDDPVDPLDAEPELDEVPVEVAAADDAWIWFQA